jgi:UDPglucose 6-dehydrogenase
LVKSGLEVDYNFEIIKSVIDVNEKQKVVLVDKVKSYFGDLSGMQFALWGLAFKPDTDDIREASALYIIEALNAAGAKVVAYDPEAMPNVKAAIGYRVEFVGNQYDALKNCDALLIATEWTAFRTPDFGKVKDMLNEPIIFDGRNIFDLEEMKNRGFYYNSIGRKTVSPFVKK